MTTIACVLRSGGIYGPEWVYAVAMGVLNNLANKTPRFRFACCSDYGEADLVAGEILPGQASCYPQLIPLEHDLPGWWSKLELFRPGLFDGPVLYLDLDTLVTGDLTDLLAYRGDFAMLSGFYRPNLAESGVMAWTPGPHTDAIWEAFMRNPEHAMKTVKRDGLFISRHVECERLQELFPDQIVSLKVHARRACPPNARLVCCHGRPKLHEPAAGWAHERWTELAA